MRAYDVMTRNVETVRPAVAASEARTRMRQKGIHHLVVSAGGELRGVVSERDLGGRKLAKTLGKWTVEDLMTAPAVTVTTRTPIRRVAALMRGRSIGSLVVTSEHGRVAGIITVADLLEQMSRNSEAQTRRGKRRRSRAEGHVVDLEER